MMKLNKVLSSAESVALAVQGKSMAWELGIDETVNVAAIQNFKTLGH